jgi:hypothetical protein
VSRPPCRPLGPDRSALVDGSLPAERRERLLGHLVHCAPCRDDVTELRRLRGALRTGTPRDAPRDLTRRLVLIAGAEARLPLWSRPFRRTRPGALTSRRRALRRAGAALVAVGTTVVGAAALGWAAAPAAALTPLADPSVRAQAEFGATLAQLPLVDDAVGAVLSVPPARLDGGAPVGGRAPAVTGSRPLPPGAAVAALRRTVVAAATVGYSGVQDFRSGDGDRSVAATVLVRSVPGHGSTAQVLDRSGAIVSTAASPASAQTRVEDDSTVELLMRHYRLTGWSDAAAAGRSATMVQATRDDGSPAARWWLDDASGIVLAHQSFDGGGAMLMSVGFAGVLVEPTTAVLAALPVSLGTTSTPTALTLSNAPALSSRGWACEGRLADLALVRLRSDGAAEPGAVHLVYSDGVSTLSVHEQRGELSTVPAGSSWDTKLGAWTRTATSSLASWQSGDRVFTVVTDGSAALLSAAVASLPHEPRRERTTMERIREGWGTLLADMKG